MEIKFEQIRAFGPSILKVSIPQQIIDSLNLYIDQIVSDKKKSEKLDHGKRLVADATQEFRIEKGLRIAQMVLCPVVKAILKEVDVLEVTERGSGGFGSTGSK